MGDKRAIAHHSDVIGEMVDIVQNVRDVDEGFAAATKLSHDGEQALGFAGGERGRRLVEDDQRGILVQRLGDLDQLTFAGGDAINLNVRVEVEADRREKIARFLADRATINGTEEAFTRELADENVFGNRQIGEKI